MDTEPFSVPVEVASSAVTFTFITAGELAICVQVNEQEVTKISLGVSLVFNAPDPDAIYGSLGTVVSHEKAVDIPSIEMYEIEDDVVPETAQVDVIFLNF